MTLALITIYLAIGLLFVGRKVYVALIRDITYGEPDGPDEAFSTAIGLFAGLLWPLVVVGWACWKFFKGAA